MQGSARCTTSATYKVLNGALVATCPRKTHKVGRAGAGGRHSHADALLLLLLSLLRYSAQSNLWHASIELSSFDGPAGERVAENRGVAGNVATVGRWVAQRLPTCPTQHYSLVHFFHVDPVIKEMKPMHGEGVCKFIGVVAFMEWCDGHQLVEKNTKHHSNQDKGGNYDYVDKTSFRRIIISSFVWINSSKYKPRKYIS